MRPASIPPFLTAVLYLIIGVFVLRQRWPREKKPLAYSLWLFTTVYWQLGWAIDFSIQNARWAAFIMRLNYSGIVFIPIAFYHLMVTVLESRRDFRWLRVAYGIGAFFAAACWIDGWMVSGFYKHWYGFYARVGFLHPFFLLFLSILVVRVLILLFRDDRALDGTANQRMQRKLLRWAYVCYLPASFDFAINYGLDCYPIGFIFTLISLSLVSYAILKHQLFDIRLVIRKTIIYSAVTLVLSLIYVAVLMIVTRAFPSFFSSAAAAAAIVMLAHPVRSRIQQWADRRFPRESLNQALLRETTGRFTHEIKRPLVNISMPAQLALADLNDLERTANIAPSTLQKTRERLTFIISQAHEAAGTIEAIRQLSTGGELPKTSVNLGAVLSRALAAEEERFKKDGVILQVTIPPNLSTIEGNSQQLEMAFSNILRNAGEAMQSMPGDQRILRCEIRQENQCLIIQIADSGPGIRRQDLGRLFDPWFSTKGSQGMGIGLYLTHEIIRRHGGDIDVTSSEGRETIFRITIPTSARQA